MLQSEGCTVMMTSRSLYSGQRLVTYAEDMRTAICLSSLAVNLLLLSTNTSTLLIE